MSEKVTISRSLFDKLTSVIYIEPPRIKVRTSDIMQHSRALTPEEYDELRKLGLE